MPQQKPNPFYALRDMILDQYLAVTAPAGHAWPKPFAVACLAACDTRPIATPEMLALTAAVLDTYSAGQLAELQVEYIIPSQVADLMGTNVEWPDMGPRTAFGSEESVAELKARRINGLKAEFELMASEVVPGGTRLILTQMMQVAEANQYLVFKRLSDSDGEPAPKASDFPTLQTYVDIRDVAGVEEAAADIRASAFGIALANGAIERARSTATRAIITAETTDAITAAYDTAVARVRSIIDGVKAQATNDPAEEPESSEA